MENSPIAYILSDGNVLTEELAKALKEKGCEVILGGNFQGKISYVFLVGKVDEKILNFTETNFIKTQVILSKKTNIEIKNNNLEIVYLDEEYFKDPTLAKEVSQKLIRAMFSYGFGKKENVIEVKAKKVIQTPVPQPVKIKQIEPKPVIREIKIKPIEPIKIIKKIQTPAPEPVKIVKKKSKIKFILITILVLFWIAFIPFVCLFASSLMLKIGYSDLVTQDFTHANFYFNFSRKLAALSHVGPSSLIQSADNVGIKSVATAQLIFQIKSEVLGKSDYDLKSQSNELYLNFNDLYEQVSLLQADMENNTAQKLFLPDLNLKRIISYIDKGRVFSQSLPLILGVDKRTNYLVLLQDSSELRPTGGVIDSFEIISFDNGRLLSNTLFNTAETDKSLLGHVDAPVPLTKYLHVSNWYLKDSNWDPDFPTSAAKAQWFLGKEINQNTDGVIAIDSKFLQKISWGPDLIDALNKKDVQIFMNDDNLENIIASLNWDGAVLPNSIGIVEANLGQNKVNPFIDRSMNLSVNSGNYNLEVNYQNSSKSDHYKAFIRVIIPASAGVLDGKYIDVAAGQKQKITFSWADLTTKGFILRKQPGVFTTPTNIVINGKTSYNTSLEADYNVNN